MDFRPRSIFATRKIPLSYSKPHHNPAPQIRHR
jgi:hypothetical protein